MQQANPDFYARLDEFLASAQKLAGIKSPHTRKVYGVLSDYPGQFLSVSEVVEKSGLKQPSVSGALAALKKAGLVQTLEEGIFRYYRLNTLWVNRLAEYLQTHLETIKTLPNWRA